MKNRIDRPRWMAGVIALALCLGMATSVEAQGRNRKAAAGHPAMEDVVDHVNAVDGTVTIGGETFRVSTMSRLVNEKGARMRLLDLRGAQDVGEGDRVEYSVIGKPGRAKKKGTLREIRELRVLAGGYE